MRLGSTGGDMCKQLVFCWCKECSRRVTCSGAAMEGAMNSVFYEAVRRRPCLSCSCEISRWKELGRAF